MLNQITRHLQPTWAFFTSFGNFSAGFFAIVVILQVGKYLISTLVNLSLIRRIHGRSWWLLGALCDTFTHFIIHRTQDSTPPDSDIQLTSVKCNAEKEVIVRSEAVAQSLESLNVSSSTDLDALRCQTNIYPPLKIDNANPTLKL